jgi:hypothetical protein
MKFLQTLSTVLCALVLGTNALPAPLPADAAAGVTVVETDMYKKVHGVYNGLTTGKRYVFTMETPLGTTPDADEEPLAGLLALQQKLGFEHIFLVVGEVKETTKGKKGKQTTTIDFSGSVFDMVIVNGETEARRRNLGTGKDKDLHRVFKHIKDNTGKTDAQILTKGKFGSVIRQISWRKLLIWSKQAMNTREIIRHMI